MEEPVQEESAEVTMEDICGNCGAELAPDDLFCSKCGESVAARECPSCGVEAKNGDLFCRKCGTRIGD